MPTSVHIYMHTHTAGRFKKIIISSLHWNLNYKIKNDEHMLQWNIQIRLGIFIELAYLKY